MAFRPNQPAPLNFGRAGPPVAYTNGVQIAVSQWDVTCLFFHSSPVAGEAPEAVSAPGTPLGESSVVQAVVMSPQHAKAFAAILAHNVAAWERQNGDITLPADVTASLSGEAQATGAEEG